MNLQIVKFQISAWIYLSKLAWLAIQYGFISVSPSDVLKRTLRIEVDARQKRDAKRRKEIVNSSKQLAPVTARASMPENSEVSFAILNIYLLIYLKMFKLHGVNRRQFSRP